MIVDKIKVYGDPEVMKHFRNASMQEAQGGGGASFEVVIVDVLPATGENGKIYLVPQQGGQEPDIYDEYLWIASTSKFERIGSTKITFQTRSLVFIKDDGTTETIKVMIQP